MRIGVSWANRAREHVLRHGYRVYGSCISVLLAVVMDVRRTDFVSLGQNKLPFCCRTGHILQVVYGKEAMFNALKALIFENIRDMKRGAQLTFSCGYCMIKGLGT